MFRPNIHFFRSLRFGIILLLLIVGIVPCIVGYISIINAYKARAITQRTDELFDHVSILSEQLSRTFFLTGHKSEMVESRILSIEKIYDGRVLILDTNMDILYDSLGWYLSLPMDVKNIEPTKQGEVITYADDSNAHIVLALPIHQSGEDTVIGILVTIASTTPIQESISIFQDRGIRILSVAVLLIFAASLVISHFIVRPIRKITLSIEEVSEGYDEKLLYVNTYTETQLLSEAFNKMLGRLKKIDDTRQEFVSNVSHELKTPLTSMKVLADSLLAMPDAPVELYQEFMKDITQEIDRENDIINDLLSLVKMDKSGQTLSMDHVNVNHLVESITKRLRPISNLRNIELVVDSFQPIIAEIDEVKMSLAITNLIENAIKYNIENGWVHVTLNSDQKYFYITVSDSGIGIPEDDQDNIFERFYRVDKSHSQEISGTGLGLSIARNVIISHRGSIKLHSSPGEGSVFTLRVPLTAVVN